MFENRAVGTNGDIHGDIHRCVTGKESAKKPFFLLAVYTFLLYYLFILFLFFLIFILFVWEKLMKISRSAG